MLVELYVKLLRRLGISVNVEKWEKSLLKVCVKSINSREQ